MTPFFERVRIWKPEPEATKENVYLQLTNSGAIIAFGYMLPRARLPGGADHGFPWLHLRFRSVDGGRTWDLEERNWWEPETRGLRASVVDRTTGEIFMFTQGTWPLQDDQGRPTSESWLIANYEKGRQMGARLTVERSLDDGRTWTATDITDQFYTYPGAGLARFIAGGIQLERVPHGRPLHNALRPRRCGRSCSLSLWERVGVRVFRATIPGFRKGLHGGRLIVPAR